METLTKPELKFKESNRAINRTHVEKIKESIKKHGFLEDKAILVDEDFNILDGQHRFMACIELDIEPIYKVIQNADKNLMIDLNSTQSSWGMMDYIHYFASQGIESYQWLSSFMEKNKINSTLALALINSEDGRTSKAIKTGTFEAEESAFVFAQQVFEFAQMISSECKLPLNRYLCASLRNLSKMREFHWDRLLEQTRHYRDRVYQCSKTTSYIDMFKSVYNFRKVNRI